MVLANAILVLSERLVSHGWISFSAEGVISEIGQGCPPDDPVTVDVQSHYLSPGFIDLHVHGAIGRDTMEASEDAFASIAEFHASGGTTSIALTTISAQLEKMTAVLEMARNFSNTHAGARLLGIHLEGPFFSSEKQGAHDPRLLRSPTDSAEIDHLLRYEDVIRQVTLAPELPGALSFISRLSEAGIIVSGGHSNCWAEEAEEARLHGMSQVTHVYNCMSSARCRGPFREAGLLEYALSEPEIRCELIADGRHVSPTLMRAIYQAKGPDGISLVTDATAGAGCDDGTAFDLGGLSCVVANGVGMIADGSTIAGSTIRMIDGIKNLVQLVEIPLVEAVQMATCNPAEALGMAKEIGALSVGARADFTIFSSDFVVRQTWVGGQIVFENWNG